MNPAAGERIEDLQYKGLSIIVKESGFRYGTDSVLLAGFVRASKKERLIDLGTGTGVIALLASARTGARIDGIEIQPEQADMASRSFKMNGVDAEVICADMREFAPVRLYDGAVCNPPYYPAEHGRVSKKGQAGFEGAATHELYLSFEEMARSASGAIKYGGRFFMCCPAERLSEAFCTLTRERLEPKRLRLVSSCPGRTPYLALIEAKKGASPGLVIEPDLVLMKEDGSYTAEADEIYHRNTDGRHVSQ